jgi:hypothetical protein
MDIGSIFLGIALVLVVAFIVARPLLEGASVRDRQPGPADNLRSEHERVLTQLRDLDFDHATGKILDEDYAAQRALLVAQGVAVLKQLDQLSAATFAPAARSGVAAQSAAPGRARSVEAEIEAAVAQRRAGAGADADIEAAIAQRQPGTHPCGQCGAAVSALDRFCPSCGAAQDAACPRCGRVAAPGDQFCGNCGQRLPTPAAGLSPAPVRR